MSGADLMGGGLGGAGRALYLTAWSAPGELWRELARGELGKVEQEGQAFTAELRGPVAMLDGPVAPETSPDCRAELGERNCRGEMAGRRLLVRVTAVDGDVVALAAGWTEGPYTLGRLGRLEGRNDMMTQIS